MYIKDQKTFPIKDKVKEAVDGLEFRKRFIQGLKDKMARLLGEAETLAKTARLKKDLNRLDEISTEIEKTSKELTHHEAEFVGRLQQLGLL